MLPLIGTVIGGGVAIAGVVKAGKELVGHIKRATTKGLTKPTATQVAKFLGDTAIKLTTKK